MKNIHSTWCISILSNWKLQISSWLRNNFLDFIFFCLSCSNDILMVQLRFGNVLYISLETWSQRFTAGLSKGYFSIAWGQNEGKEHILDMWLNNLYELCGIDMKNSN